MFDLHVVHCVTNITTTAADLGWTENGSATQWNVEVGLPGFTPGTGAEVVAVTGTTDNPWNATGLTASTAYDFYVQADCGGGDFSTWVGPFTFTTACDAYNIPWTEGFESITTAGEIPNCMAVTGDFTTGTSPQTYNRDARTGANYLYTRWSADDWFFTVGVNLTAGESYDFSYWFVTDGNSGWLEISLWVGAAQDVISMTDSLNGVVDATNTDYVQLTGTYAAPSTGVYYFGIHVVANISPMYITFDDLMIDFSTSVSNVNTGSNINIYPNPTNNIIYITNAQNSTIYVYNILGKIVISIDNADKFNTIDMSSYAQGTYIVKIINNKDIITRKINLIK